ncbi:hypothetical protein OG275_23190 [Streptomyces niveus]|uniref:hypothetical protein n=1 Tax=Streptomyces niveus TaxID=193462 RepID=UPI002E34EDAD|nr:hypothetical protein [Streptomyces niveus]
MTVTMTATLRTLITLPRVLRHGAAVGAQLPPDASVVLDPPTPELRAALTAAYAGDHAPARDLLAATRLGAEWERRGGYVPRLAESALHSPGWLDAWLAESPRDPDAVLVKAEHGVRQAWEIRTGARASSVSRDQFQAFFALLDDAVPVIGAAAELNPTDPVPWQVALTHARGSQAPREVFDAYWAEATARAPHHYGCHVSAMQYLCDKWYGSHAEMFDFAERAAQEALPGSKLHALPLLAAVEYDVVADGGNGGAGIERSRIHAALKRAQELSDAYPQGDPEVAGVRNHLALMLVLAGRHGEALEQFRAVGSHATQYPWAYLGDARGEFLDFRTGVRMRVAARVPFFSRPKPPQFPKLPAAPAPSHPGTPRFLALVAAPPHTVADAALMCGVPLRIAPAPDRSSYVELAADPEPGIRATLLGEDRLTAAADNITTGEPWPALVLRRSGDRSGFTLLQQGKKVADHDWDPAAPVPDHAAVSATAATLARVYGVADTRPITNLLRGSDDPARRQSALVDTLGLPPVPAGFGSRDEVLTTLAGARVLARRGFFAGIVDTMSGDRSGRPTAPRRPRWWVLRIAALPLFVLVTAYAWWSPDIGWFRASLSTIATCYLTGQLAGAWRRRGRATKR